VDVKPILILNLFLATLGSATELECQCIIANDLGFLSNYDFNELNKELVEIQKMIVALIDKL